MSTLNKKQAQFAPGIKKKDITGQPLRKLTKGELVDVFMQLHKTLRNPKKRHMDLRLGTPETDLFSWAIPKGELPINKEKKLAVPTSLHDYSYGRFSGGIGKGYGAGQVELKHAGKALITNITPNSISFTLADTRVPVRYSLVKPEKSDNWILIAKPIPKDVEGVGNKPIIKSVKSDNIKDILLEAEDVSEKIDGAHLIYQLSQAGKPIEAYSVNKSVSGEPITQTEKIFKEYIMTPKELENTILRGEVFGTKGGKAIPFRQVSAILNSSIAKAIKTQKAEDIQMVNALFDIVKYKGELPPKRYIDRKALLGRIVKQLKNEQIIVPESGTNEEAVKLYQDIIEGKNLRTEEGVVAHLPGEKTVKVKQRPETTVYIKGTFPGKGKRSRLIGGLTYSDVLDGEEKGKVGTGFTEDELMDLTKNIKQYIGKPIRITSQGAFESGAHRAPSFEGFEVAANVKQAQKRIAHHRPPPPKYGPPVSQGITNAPALKIQPVVNKPIIPKHGPPVSQGVTNQPVQAVKDMIYGLGGKGVLGNSDDDKRLYQEIATILIGQTYSEQNKDLKKLIKRWKGPTHDQAYSDRIMSYLNSNKQPLENIPPAVLYQAFSKSETSGESDPFIFTKIVPKTRKEISTAYGPVQLTKSMLKDYYNRMEHLWPDKAHRDYIKRYIEQGDKQYDYLLNTLFPMIKSESEKSSSLIKTIETDNVIPLSTTKTNKPLYVAIADTPDKCKKGLSKVSNLPDNHGMFFTKAGLFWMKDCEIPLDLIFLDKSGTIVDKQIMEVPKQSNDLFLTTYAPKDPTAIYAIETNAGWCDKNNIKIGDKICVKR